MEPALLLLLVGLVYILGFGGLSVMRRQGLSLRFAVEGLLIIAVVVALSFGGIWVHPFLLVIILYGVTMRVRMLADLGNLFVARGKFARAHAAFRLALRLFPDTVGRQIVLINRGVAEMRSGNPEEAYTTLLLALNLEPHTVMGTITDAQFGAKYLAALHYNLGLACQRTRRDAEATRHWEETIAILPHSLYAQAAARAQQEHRAETSEALYRL